MNHWRKNWVKKITAGMLVVLFLSPLVIKTLHLFLEEHEHFVCTAKHENHFHKNHSKEDLICKITLQEFSADLFFRLPPDKKPFFTELPVTTEKQYRHKIIPFISLRAPPLVL